MNDTDWVKQHLQNLFNPTLPDSYKLCEIGDKIRRFGGKLYKYYSFEDPWSLNNLKDDIVHFSTPDKFNDPFDCSIGFSMEHFAEKLLDVLLDRDILATKLDPKSKQLLQLILFGQPSPCESKQAQLFEMLAQSSKLIDAITRGADLNEKEIQADIVKELLSGENALKFFQLILSDNIQKDLKYVSESQSLKKFLDVLDKDPKIMDALYPQGFSEENKTFASAIVGVAQEHGILNKIKKLAKLTGQDLSQLEDAFCEVEGKSKNLIKEWAKQVNSNFAISCFSEYPSNVLMWSHYAGKHSGFCVEYDFTKIKNLDYVIRLMPVSYSEQRQFVPLQILDYSDLENIKVSSDYKATVEIMLLLLGKSDIWAYEREWRLICEQTLLDSNLNCNLPIVSAVYLGANVSPENDSKIRNLAIEKEIKLFKYRLAHDMYKLNLAEITL